MKTEINEYRQRTFFKLIPETVEDAALIARLSVKAKTKPAKVTADFTKGSVIGWVILETIDIDNVVISRANR